jgi:alpha-galactosidase
MRKFVCVIIGVLAIVIAREMSVMPTGAAPLPLSQRPVMGYNTWYQFRTDITERNILKQANYLVTTGLAATGYNYVNLDDGWMASKRTDNGALTWDAAKFPHGIPWLEARLHAMGLKFGIYEAIGKKTCQHFPGSWGHYAQDAKTFAQWGVDFVKIDECGGLPARTTVSRLTSDFRAYGSDLRATNPAVIYSEELPLCSMGKPGFLATARASPSFANMWRVAPDEEYTRPASYTILSHLADDLHLHRSAGPGHWNDLDMLVPGKQTAMPFDWSLQEEQSQLSVWAEEASPLLISTDLSTLSPAELAALKNPLMIAIDQSGAQAPKMVTSGHIEAVMKGADGGLAILLANLGARTASGHFTLSQLGITSARASGSNVWTGKTTTFSGVTVTLGAGQTTLLVLKATRALVILGQRSYSEGTVFPRQRWCLATR